DERSLRDGHLEPGGAHLVRSEPKRRSVLHGGWEALDAVARERLHADGIELAPPGVVPSFAEFLPEPEVRKRLAVPRDADRDAAVRLADLVARVREVGDVHHLARY